MNTGASPTVSRDLSVSSGPREARPQGRPAAHPIGRRPLASLEQASDGRQGPEPQACTPPVIMNDRSSKGKKPTLKQPAGLKQNDRRFLHLNSEPRHGRSNARMGSGAVSEYRLTKTRQIRQWGLEWSKGTSPLVDLPKRIPYSENVITCWPPVGWDWVWRCQPSGVESWLN